MTEPIRPSIKPELSPEFVASLVAKVRAGHVVCISFFQPSQGERLVDIVALELSVDGIFCMVNRNCLLCGSGMLCVSILGEERT